MNDRLKLIGNYRIIRLLGKGGFAEVYLGEHIYLKRLAAIKVLHARLGKEGVEKFLIEARIVASLEHPNIVRVLDYDVEGDTPFLIMNYAPNGSLRQRHSRNIPVPPVVVVGYVKQVASALQYAHNRKLVHCDVKPHNMLLGSNDEVLLSDFGLVLFDQYMYQYTWPQTSQIGAGTPPYMAPEQFTAMAVPASDQYSLAVVVYEWLCGQLPFSKGDMAYLHNRVAPPPLREKLAVITPAIEKVVLRALKKDINQRFASVKDFSDALEVAYIAEPYQFSHSAYLPIAPGSLAADDEDPDDDDTVPGRNSRHRAPSSPAAGAQPVPAQPALIQQPALAQPFLTQTMPTQLVNTSSQPPSPVIHASNAFVSAPPPPNQNKFKKVSRRHALTGLVGFLAILCSSIVALLWDHISNSSAFGLKPVGKTATAPARTPTPVPTATPIPLPMGTPLIIHPASNDVKSLAWLPTDGSLIASGDGNSVDIWNAKTGNDVLKHSYSHHTDAVKSVAWSPNGELIASGSQDSTVRVWSTATGVDQPFSPYKRHSKTVRSVAWSPNGKLIASGGEDNTVRVWDSATGIDSLFPPYTGHTKAVVTVAWSPNGQSIVSASFDSTVRIWNAASGLDSLKPLTHPGPVRAVAWSPDGSYIASGTEKGDNKIYIWDAASGNQLKVFEGHTDAVQTVVWSPHDGKYLASASFDTMVKIWEVASGKCVLTYSYHKTAIWTVAWSPRANLIASGSVAPDSNVQVWRPL